MISLGCQVEELFFSRLELGRTWHAITNATSFMKDSTQDPGRVTCHFVHLLKSYYGLCDGRRRRREWASKTTPTSTLVKPGNAHECGRQGLCKLRVAYDWLWHGAYLLLLPGQRGPLVRSGLSSRRTRRPSLPWQEV